LETEEESMRTDLNDISLEISQYQRDNPGNLVQISQKTETHKRLWDLLEHVIENRNATNIKLQHVRHSRELIKVALNNAPTQALAAPFRKLTGNNNMDSNDLAKLISGCTIDENGEDGANTEKCDNEAREGDSGNKDISDILAESPLSSSSVLQDDDGDDDSFTLTPTKQREMSQQQDIHIVLQHAKTLEDEVEYVTSNITRCARHIKL
jgi:hypothetical protein